MRSDRSSTKYLCIVVLDASKHKMYSFLAFNAFSFASWYLTFLWTEWKVYMSSINFNQYRPFICGIHFWQSKSPKPSTFAAPLRSNKLRQSPNLPYTKFFSKTSNGKAWNFDREMNETELYSSRECIDSWWPRFTILHVRRTWRKLILARLEVHSTSPGSEKQIERKVESKKREGEKRTESWRENREDRETRASSESSRRLGLDFTSPTHLVHFLFHELVFLATRELLGRGIRHLELAALLFRHTKLRFRLPWPRLVCLIRFHRGMQLVQHSKDLLVRLVAYFTALKSIGLDDRHF